MNTAIDAAKSDRITIDLEEKHLDQKSTPKSGSGDSLKKSDKSRVSVHSDKKPVHS